MIRDLNHKFHRSLRTTPISRKRSQSEKAILGALGEFRGMLGAALGIQKLILGIRNSILGMKFHDLSNTNTTILETTPGAIPGTDGNPPEDFIGTCILGACFQELGWSSRARRLGLSRVLLALPIGFRNGSTKRPIGFPNRSSNRTRKRPKAVPEYCWLSR